jgi:NAD(P)-dependent dehydrogenase (short-subunit alcohol dehydrogenase family)
MVQNVVVVTGVGRGLGKSLAETFVQDGAVVCGIARSADSLEKISNELSNENFFGLVADVTDYEQISAAFETVIDKYGKVDLLINNAAVYQKSNFLEESPQEWTAAILTNLSGVSYCCKAVLPHMIKAGSGRIFNVGSWADINPAPNSSAYSTSKGGLHALTKSIARDIEHLNLPIEIHEWIPGHLNTRMSDFTGIDPSISAAWALKLSRTAASKKNSVFENDYEWFPPKRIKERIKEKILFWR